MFRIAIGLVFALVTLRADDSPPESKLMDLNVIAVDNRGQPVNDLTADDFQVSDAGKPQKIAFFRHNDSSLRQAPSLGPNEFSNRAGVEVPHATIILFDLLNEGFSTRGVAANQLVHDLETLETADYLFLYFVTLDGRLVAVHGVPGEGEVRQPGGAAWTRQIKQIMDDAMRAVMRMRPPDIDVAVRVQLTYATLESLAVQLSRVPGRKNIVWITDGVPIALGPGRSDTGDFVDFTLQMRHLSEGLDRSGVSIYPVRQVFLGSPDNIGGTSGGAGGTGGGGTGVQSLATLDDFAGMTGGRPNAGKDIGSAVRQAMSDLRFSYQIGYNAPPQSRDGKFHKLRVVCKRKGVRIQAKSGYYAWPEPPGTAAKDALDAAASTAFDAAEIGLRGTLSPDPKDPRTAHLNVRIDAKDIAFGRDGDQYTGQLRLAVAGLAAGGRTEGSPVIPLDLHYSAPERDQALKEGIAFSHDVAIGGPVSKVRLIVFDRGSNAIGSLTLPFNAAAPNQPR